MFTITPAKESEVTNLVCPHCHEKVPRVGIKKGSKLEGLTFRCKRCGQLWEVKTE